MGAALMLLCSLVFRPGRTEAQSTGIAADRFVPAPGPAAFAQVEGASVAPLGQVWLTGGAVALGDPLRLRNARTGVQVSEPVQLRVGMDLAAELGILRNRLAIGVGLPAALWQRGDRLVGTGGSAVDADAPLATTAVGDIRLRIKALITKPEQRLLLAVVTELTLPGGGQRDFVATQSATVSPRLISGLRVGRISAAANAAVRFAPQRSLYESSLHNTFEWGVAAAGELPAKRISLALGVEATGALNLVSGNYLHSTELRSFLRLAWWRAAIDFGGGGGFGPLTPSWRAFLVVRTWFGRRDSEQTGCQVRPATL